MPDAEPFRLFSYSLVLCYTRPSPSTMYRREYLIRFKDIQLSAVTNATGSLMKAGRSIAYVMCAQGDYGIPHPDYTTGSGGEGGRTGRRDGGCCLPTCLGSEYACFDLKNAPCAIDSLCSRLMPFANKGI